MRSSSVVDAAVAAVSSEAIEQLAAELSAAPGDAWSEADVASRVERWCATHAPGLRVDVDHFGTERANVRIEAGAAPQPDLTLYAHLDTTLTGNPEFDATITADSCPVPPMRRIGDELVGLGLGVARAPMAAGLIALRSAAAALEAVNHEYHEYCISAVYTSGGTHHFDGPVLGMDVPGHFGVGVRRALERWPHPRAVLNIKAGAPAPLHEEPGAAYLGVLLTLPWEPALFRTTDPGLAAFAGAVASAVEAWRADLVARTLPRDSTSGREVALGAMSFGSLRKPDLLPGRLQARVFVVTVPGDDIHQLAEELQHQIECSVGRIEGALRVPTVAVGVDVADRAGTTSPNQLVVRLTRDSWSRHVGTLRNVSGWRGSTDGVIYRQHGIPVVRAGPEVGRDVNDPRLDRVSIPALTAFARMYAEVLTLSALEPVQEGEH